MYSTDLLRVHFNCETELGARLDSLADIGTYILAIVGIFVFKYADIEPHFIFSFSLLFPCFLSLILLALIKFRRFSSLHLYSWKIGRISSGWLFYHTLFDWFL